MKRTLVMVLLGASMACTYGFRTACDADAGEQAVGPFCYLPPSGGGGSAGGVGGGVSGGDGGGGAGGGFGGGAIGGGGVGGGGVVRDGGPCDVTPDDGGTCRRCPVGAACLTDGGCSAPVQLQIAPLQEPDPIRITPTPYCGRVTLLDGGVVPPDVALPSTLSVLADDLTVSPVVVPVFSDGRFVFTVQAAPGQWAARRVRPQGDGGAGFILPPFIRTYAVFAPPRLDLNPDPARDPAWTFDELSATDPRTDDGRVLVRVRWEDGGAGVAGRPPAILLDGGLVDATCESCPGDWRCACAAVPLTPLADDTMIRRNDALAVQFADGGADAGRVEFKVTRYRWLRRLPGAITSSPAIDRNGQLYVGIEPGPGAGAVVALSLTGAVRWSLDAGGEVESLGLSRLSDGGTVGYASLNTDAGAALMAFSVDGVVMARHDFPGVRTERDLTFAQEGDLFTPVVHLVGPQAALFQWNIERPDGRMPVPLEDEEPTLAGLDNSGLRSNMMFSSDRVQYVGRTDAGLALLRVPHDGGNGFSSRPEVTALTNGFVQVVPQGTLTYLWGRDAGVVLMVPGGPATLTSSCPVLLDRNGQLTGCAPIGGERFDVTPVLTAKGPSQLFFRQGYQMQVSTNRTLAFISPDGGVALVHQLLIPGGRPSAPLTLDCHRRSDGGLTGSDNAVLYVTTSAGDVVAIITPASGLDPRSAWPRHQRAASNIGSESAPADIRGECP